MVSEDPEMNKQGTAGKRKHVLSFGVKPSFTKNFISARYSILSILRDTDNTPASDSCMKQTTR
jgi:hypothetical protein